MYQRPKEGLGNDSQVFFSVMKGCLGNDSQVFFSVMKGCLGKDSQVFQCNEGVFR